MDAEIIRKLTESRDELEACLDSLHPRVDAEMICILHTFIENFDEFLAL